MSADVSYRAARADDAAALSELARNSFVATFAHLYRPSDLAAFLAASYAPALQYAEIIDPARDTGVATDAAGGIIGYVQLGPLSLDVQPARETPIELKRLYVDAAFHGAGVAQGLMCWSLKRAQDRGASCVYLSVWSENIRAQRFYARYGFTKVGQHKFRVGDQLDDDWIYRGELDTALAAALSRP